VVEDAFSVVGRRVVVVGAARSGIAAADLLARRGARVVLSESRQRFDEATRLAHAGIELELGGHRNVTFGSADLVVVSPGVPTELPALEGARARGVEVIGELELASRWVKGPIVAVTGTKGKSTTTTLLGRMFTEARRDVLVGGNIGVPLSTQVDASTAETVHVVEVSSFQLETTVTFRPWIALWLNFADDHLDRHPTVEAYAAAKARVFANQQATDWAVVNADDPTVMERSRGIAAQRVMFSPSGGFSEAPSGNPANGFLVHDDWIVKRTARGRADTTVERLVPVSAVELTGRHLLNNVVAAAAVATVAGVPARAMFQALRGFQGLEHVMEPVGRIGDVRFVNDSKATNVEAARRSIESFEDGVVALIGGRFKGGDLRGLRAPLAAHGRGVIAIGEAAPLVREALHDVVPVVDAASMGEAVTHAYDAARPDGVVLLAPACASFDWFKDYAERGRVFKEEVAKLRLRVRGG
jgi:UDP-N-acetylmuramoylalanine--D-glutamate ligase